MKQSGIIYQYPDRPSEPEAIIIDAFATSQAGLESPQAVPVNQPDELVVEVTNVASTVSDAVSPKSIPTTNLNQDYTVHTQKQITVPANNPVPVRKQHAESKYPQTKSHDTALKTKLSYIFRAAVGGGIIGVLILFSPFLITEAQLRLNPPKPQEEIVFPDIEIVDDVVDVPTFSRLVNEKYINKINPVDTEYSLVIPKIGVNSKIIANVDPGDKTAYTQALKQGAAHAKGTALPDEAGTSYLFAHSTDYVWNITNFNAIFYLLKDLDTGDQVHIVYHNKLFPYRVTEKRIVNADDTYYLKRDLNKKTLILQTCYPPGTTWKRLLVFAEPINSLIGTGDELTYNIDKPASD